MACQDGYSSGIVCGLVVDDADATWTDNTGVSRRGVLAHQVDGQTAVQVGDSGGLVFNLSSGNIRQTRGIVSSGGGNQIRWTQAPYIFSTLGLRLP